MPAKPASSQSVPVPFESGVTGVFIGELGQFYTVEEIQKSPETWPYVLSGTHNEQGDNPQIGFGWKMSDERAGDAIGAAVRGDASAQVTALKQQLADQAEAHQRQIDELKAQLAAAKPSDAPKTVQVKASDTVGGKERS